MKLFMGTKDDKQSIEKYKRKQIEVINSKINDVTRLIESSNDYKLFLRRSKLFQRLNKFKEGIADCNSALSIVEKEHFLNRNYYQLLIEVLLTTKNIRKEQIKFIHKNDITGTETKKISSIKKLLINNLKAIIDAIRHKKVLNQTDERILVNIYKEKAEVLYSIGAYDEALKSIEKTEEVYKIDLNINERLKLKIRCFLKLDSYENVKILLTKMEQLNKDSWKDFEFTASIKESINDLDGAINDLTKAISIDGRKEHFIGQESLYCKNYSKADQFVSRGRLKEKIGDNESAYKDYLKAYNIDKEIVSRNRTLYSNEGLKAFLRRNYYS